MAARRPCVRFRHLLALAILFLFARPALADVTLRYAQSGNDAAITMRADDAGRVRMDVTGGYYLFLDGVSYLVLNDSQGTFVCLQSDFVDLLNSLQMAPAPSGTLPAAAVSEHGTEVVAGRLGERFTIGSPGETRDVLDVVISRDPDLAPIGRAMAVQFPPFFAAVGGRVPGVGDALAGLLRRGTMLKLGTIFQLQAIDRAPIAAGAFVLPGRLISREALRERVMREAGR